METTPLPKKVCLILHIYLNPELAIFGCDLPPPLFFVATSFTFRALFILNDFLHFYQNLKAKLQLLTVDLCRKGELGRSCFVVLKTHLSVLVFELFV